VQWHEPKSGYLALAPRRPRLVQRKLEVIGPDSIDRASHHALPTEVQRDRKSAPGKITQHETEGLPFAKPPARIAPLGSGQLTFPTHWHAAARHE
jgi:hypothetical protein